MWTMARKFDKAVRDRIVAWARRVMFEHRIESGNALARRLGLTSGAVSMIFTGERTPGLDFLLAMHREFHISSDVLLDTDPPSPGAVEAGKTPGRLRHA